MVQNHSVFFLLIPWWMPSLMPSLMAQPGVTAETVPGAFSVQSCPITPSQMSVLLCEAQGDRLSCIAVFLRHKQERSGRATQPSATTTSQQRLPHRNLYWHSPELPCFCADCGADYEEKHCGHVPCRIWRTATIASDSSRVDARSVTISR